MASIDSSLAGWMKLHVFTTSTSAASGSRTSSCPRRASTPSITSLSTRLWRAELQRAQRHLPLPHLLAHDVGERAQLEVVGGAEVNGGLLASHLGRLVPEVEALCDLAQRLLERVVDLLEIDAADHVEGRHFGGPSIGGRADHVNPGRRREAEERGIERDVAALVREREARRRTQRVGDARLLDRGVGLAHHERERADAGVLARHQPQHPARGLVALEARLEVALDPPEAGEEADRSLRLERLGERRLDHLLVPGLVDPERLAVTDDELRVGRRVVPAHAVRLLEGERAVRLERRGERGGLDRLAEVGGERGGGLVAALQAGEDALERVVRGGSRGGRERKPEKEREESAHVEAASPFRARPASAPPPRAERSATQAQA